MWHHLTLTPYNLESHYLRLGHREENKKNIKEDGFFKKRERKEEGVKDVGNKKKEKGKYRFK